MRPATTGWRVRALPDEHNDKYILPASEMNYKNLTGELYAKKNWLIGEVSVLGTLRGAYRKNLSGVYHYLHGGAGAQFGGCQGVHQKDFAIQHGRLLESRAGLNVAFPLGNRTAMFCHLEGDYRKPLNLDSTLQPGWLCLPRSGGFYLPGNVGPARNSPRGPCPILLLRSRGHGRDYRKASFTPFPWTRPRREPAAAN